MMQKYGYIRVSAKDQNTDRQFAALEAYEIPEKNLFVDKQSGKDFNRPAYHRLVRRIKPGDLLIVKSIDRLGRNYDEIIRQWQILTKEKGCDVQVVDMPLLDTTKSKDILGTFIADLVLQILSYCAHTERENIRQRQAEGIAAAKAKGIHFGRPQLPIPEDFEDEVKLWRNKQVSQREALEHLNMERSRFYRVIKTLGI